jgi:16S rRNA (guanine527-N7)-methyltransferase
MQAFPENRMTQERIKELLASFIDPRSLSNQQLAQVSDYLQLLLKWNSKMNLTAVRDSEEILTRHFGESFFAARHLLPNADSATTAIDVGSGAGFPGLPLKIWDPGLSLTLIEANQKKAVFLREAVRSLKLARVTVLNQRAETAGDEADLVSLRAVEQFEKAITAARKLVKPLGRLALLIGESQVATARALFPDVQWGQPIAIPISRNRVLLIGCAESNTQRSARD